MYTCSKCSDKESFVVVAVIILIVATFCAVVVILYLVSKVNESSTSKGRGGVVQARLRRLAHNLPFQALKITIVSWQILTQVGASGGAVCWPVHRVFPAKRWDENSLRTSVICSLRSL